jgi:microcystin degradation protein MlrC
MCDRAGGHAEHTLDMNRRYQPMLTRRNKKATVTNFDRLTATQAQHSDRNSDVQLRITGRSAPAFAEPFHFCGSVNGLIKALCISARRLDTFLAIVGSFKMQKWQSVTATPTST